MQPVITPSHGFAVRAPRHALLTLATSLLLAGCGMTGDTFTSKSENVEVAFGPPIEDVVTPFDEALSCIRGKVNPGIIFAVGQVVDATGKESFAEGGTGKFVSQGAGEMVQSSLFRAGVTLVNRRDPNIAVAETQWGIRDLQQQVPVNFYISGSINSLDFIPGSGFSTTIAGAGPRYRQNRILIGLDLSMTDAFTGRIVANVPLQKQIFSREVGLSVGRFFGETLVSFDAGGMEREALHFTMRQMLSLGTLQLLGQLMPEDAFAPCVAQLQPIFGAVQAIPPIERSFIDDALSSSSELRQARATAIPEPVQQEPQVVSQTQPARTVDQQLAELRNQTSIYAARSIAAAEKSLGAATRSEQAESAAEAMQLMVLSVQLLQRASQLGMSGPEGDATAIVVERAMELSEQANAAIAPQTPAVSDAPPAAEPQSVGTVPPAALGGQPQAASRGLESQTDIRTRGIQ